MSNSPYEVLIAAKLGEDRIERVLVKETGDEEIRFSWWKGGAYQRNALVITEEELLALTQEAMTKGVFDQSFLRRLSDSLNKHLKSTE